MKILPFFILGLVLFLTSCAPVVAPQSGISLSGWAGLIDSIDGTYHSDSFADRTTFLFEGPVIVSAETDNKGYITIPNLTVGTDKVTVTRDGYGTQIIYNYEARENNALRVFLYPKFDYKTIITSIDFLDTVFTTKILVGEEVSPIGDTISKGHYEDGPEQTLEYYKMVVSGTYHQPQYQKQFLFPRFAYLLFSKTVNILPTDPDSWINWVTYNADIKDSTFSFTIYNQFGFIPGNFFKKGEEVFVAAYISPWGAPSYYTAPNMNKPTFPCFAEQANVKSFILP